MSRTANRRDAFTLVEMLVVIGIIAVLAALLLPALSGAKNRSYKLEETNLIRQTGLAWTLYANSNNDAALPGYVTADVQATWNVSYRFPDRTRVPAADAQPYTWRLLQYIDFSHDAVHGYRRETEASELMMSSAPEATDIAFQPAFGYNAYYVGGWWEMVVSDTGESLPRPKFTGAQTVGSDRPLNVIARSPATIRSPGEMIVFCSSSEVPAGTVRTDDLQLGSHVVVPPWLAEVEMWSRNDTPSVITALEATSVPIGRYTGQVAIVFADGHTEPNLPGALTSPRMWINGAGPERFGMNPDEFQHTDAFWWR